MRKLTHADEDASPPVSAERLAENLFMPTRDASPTELDESWLKGWLEAYSCRREDASPPVSVEKLAESW